MSPPELTRPAPGEPVFAEAWQARAFAIATELNRRGRLPWPAFTAALGVEIARDGADYWRAWLRALEARLAAEALASPEAVAATTEAWLDAAARTPHGSPIRLEGHWRR
ncbi:MAG: nitrile hydratase accessory protein [Amaricoccus sp.]